MVNDIKTNNRFGLLLLNYKDIVEINARSGELAEKNEYQVHFWTLTFRCYMSEQFIDITVPTAIYNYKQTVSSAAVNFDLKDVIAVSEKIEPLAIVKEKILIDAFKKDLENVFDKVELMRNNMSNIHRHPGKMHSFSGTDYDKNRNNPGICFPFEKANLTPIFSGIITHNPLELGHLEYRVATGDNKLMNYEEGICYHCIKGYKETQSKLMSFLGVMPKVVNNQINCPSNLNFIVEKFIELEYAPSYDAIISSNVTQSKISYSYGKGSFDNVPSYSKKELAKKEKEIFGKDRVKVHEDQTDIYRYLNYDYDDEDLGLDEVVYDDEDYGALTLDDMDTIRQDLCELYGCDANKVLSMSNEALVNTLKLLEGI